MFPYIDVSHWHVGRFPFHPFALLVAIAIATGSAIATVRARRSGIDPDLFAKLGLCVIAAAFVGGHLAKFFYSPSSWQEMFRQPALLFNVFSGQASFGAFIAAYLAGTAFLYLHKVPRPDHYLYGDAGCFAIPFSWWIGRVGCYLVHDHPGIRTGSILGVRYPGGTRYDLGLLEALFLLGLSGAFLVLDRRPRPRGFYFVAFLLAYGTFRLWADHLHVDAPRYAGWTVDEILALILLAKGLISIVDLSWLQVRGKPIHVK